MDVTAEIFDFYCDLRGSGMKCTIMRSGNSHEFVNRSLMGRTINISIAANTLFILPKMSGLP